MDRRPDIEVDDWSAEFGRAPPVVPVRRSRRLWIPPPLLGFIGTCLVHALLVQSLVLWTAAKKIKLPEITGPGSIASPQGQVSELTLVVVTSADAAPPEESISEEMASKGVVAKELSMILISPDPAPAVDIPADALSDDPKSETVVASGDPAGRARLFGIYSGQIQARIERIWRRPRTAVTDPTKPNSKTVGDDIFRCQVQIVQDATGAVKEILLPNCNGTSAWQKSLVVAIQQASPLPAPPDPAVFSRVMAMTFIGLEFRAGNSTDEYEIEPRHIQAQN